VGLHDENKPNTATYATRSGGQRVWAYIWAAAARLVFCSSGYVVAGAAYIH